MVERIDPLKFLIPVNQAMTRTSQLFKNRDNLILVPGNDSKALEEVFKQAKEEKFFIELVAIEPIQGEGNPGYA